MDDAGVVRAHLPSPDKCDHRSCHEKSDYFPRSLSNSIVTKSQRRAITSMRSSKGYVIGRLAPPACR